MAVALATLETDIYTTFRNHIISGDFSLITDSVIVNAEQVTSNYEDDISHKRGFPVIEISDPDIDEISNDRFGNVQRADIVVPFLIVEDNSADSKATTDAVKNKYLTGKHVFKAVGLHGIRILSAGKSVVGKNNKHYHFKRFTINCEYRERIDPPS